MKWVSIPFVFVVALISYAWYRTFEVGDVIYSKWFDRGGLATGGTNKLHERVYEYTMSDKIGDFLFDGLMGAVGIWLLVWIIYYLIKGD